MPGPLDGIAVVDLTSYIAGSYAGMMLADMGGRVTKGEALAGDSFRELPGFYGWSRGKRSIAVDLKTPAGRQIVEELAERSDVFMENMRPGVADRLGVGYERLHALNPRLVYSSVTAFGSTGPYVDRPGFDPLLQAMSGAMALQGSGPRRSRGRPALRLVAAASRQPRGAPAPARVALRVRAARSLARAPGQARHPGRARADDARLHE